MSLYDTNLFCLCIGTRLIKEKGKSKKQSTCTARCAGHTAQLSLSRQALHDIPQTIPTLLAILNFKHSTPTDSCTRDNLVFEFAWSYHRDVEFPLTHTRSLPQPSVVSFGIDSWFWKAEYCILQSVYNQQHNVSINYASLSSRIPSRTYVHMTISKGNFVLCYVLFLGLLLFSHLFSTFLVAPLIIYHLVVIMFGFLRSCRPL